MWDHLTPHYRLALFLCPGVVMVVLVVPMVVPVLVLSCVILVPGSCPTPPPQPPYQPLAGLIVHTCNGAL